MQYKVCRESARGACKFCGGFYCARHGGRSGVGPSCAPCYDRRRVGFSAVALLAIGLAIAGVVVAVAIGRRGAPGGLIGFTILLAAVFLGLAGLPIGLATRAFPPEMNPPVKGTSWPE